MQVLCSLTIKVTLNQVLWKKKLWNKCFAWKPTHLILAIFIKPLLQPSFIMADQIKGEEKEKRGRHGCFTGDIDLKMGSEVSVQLADKNKEREPKLWKNGGLNWFRRKEGLKAKILAKRKQMLASILGTTDQPVHWDWTHLLGYY